jgi:hypothetical protein
MNEINSTEILNEIEQEKIALFNEDKIMKEAVRKVLLAGIYENGTLKSGVPADPKRNFLLSSANNMNLTNEVLGQEVRAAYWGIALLEKGFDKLSEIKKDEKLEDNKIPQ